MKKILKPYTSITVTSTFSLSTISISTTIVLLLFILFSFTAILLSSSITNIYANDNSSKELNTVNYKDIETNTVNKTTEEIINLHVEKPEKSEKSEKLEKAETSETQSTEIYPNEKYQQNEKEISNPITTNISTDEKTIDLEYSSLNKKNNSKLKDKNKNKDNNKDKDKTPQKKFVGIFYLNKIFANIHQRPSIDSTSILAIACSHPLRVYELPSNPPLANNTSNPNWTNTNTNNHEDWALVTTENAEGYIKKSFISEKRNPACFQDRVYLLRDLHFDIDGKNSKI